MVGRGGEAQAADGGGGGEGPLLVLASGVLPLDHVRAVGDGGRVDVDGLAAVHGGEAKEAGVGRGEGELLVVAAPVVPKVDVGAVGGGDAVNIRGASAEGADDAVLAGAEGSDVPVLAVGDVGVGDGALLHVGSVGGSVVINGHGLAAVAGGDLVNAGGQAGGDGVAITGERGEAEVVEGAAVVAILRSAVGAGGGGFFLRLRNMDTEAVGIVADDDIPDRAGGALACVGDDAVRLGGAALAVAPRVVGEGDGLQVVVAGDVFGAGEEAVVVVRVEVDALVPGHLADGGHEADAHDGVLLVAAGFLPLAEGGRVEDGDGVVDGAVAAAGFEVVHRLVDLGLVVAEDADGEDGGHVAEIPVGPVILDVRVVVVEQELVVERVEHGDHHVLELVEIGGGPAGVAAHDLGGVGHLVTVEAGGEETVGVAGDGGEGGAPGVEDLDGFVGVGGVAGDLPAEGVLVGGGGVVVEQGAVVGRGAAIDDGDGARAPGALRVGAGDEFVPAAFPRLGVGGDLLGHAGEVRVGVKHAGVDGGEQVGAEGAEEQTQGKAERARAAAGAGQGVVHGVGRSKSGVGVERAAPARGAPAWPGEGGRRTAARISRDGGGGRPRRGRRRRAGRRRRRARGWRRG